MNRSKNDRAMLLVAAACLAWLVAPAPASSIDGGMAVGPTYYEEVVTSGDLAGVENPAGGPAVEVESILDLQDPNTTIFEAHMGMTRDWAAQLLSLGYPADLPLAYDRVSAEVALTLGELATGAAAEHETFHFVLNNTVIQDNRIPPYGMSYETARQRNALPVPASQYGGGAGGTYDYWAEIELVPPAAEAVYATIELLYQPTSWEYIQFLYLANNGQNAFLAEEGVNMLDAWLNAGGPETRMAKPYVMASTVWGDAPVPPEIFMTTDELTTWSVSKQGDFIAPASVFAGRDTVGIRARVVDESFLPLSGAQLFLEIRDAGGATVVSLQGFSDNAGLAELKWKTGRRQAAGAYTAVVSSLIKSGYSFDPALGQTDVSFSLE